MDGTLKDWLAQLAAIGWHVDPEWQAEARQMALPCGPVVWISGPLGGMPRDAWLGLDDGIVRLHGGSESDDCDVAEFVRRLTAPPAVEKAEQGRLF